MCICAQAKTIRAFNKINYEFSEEFSGRINYIPSRFYILYVFHIISTVIICIFKRGRIYVQRKNTITVWIFKQFKKIEQFNPYYETSNIFSRLCVLFFNNKERDSL